MLRRRHTDAAERRSRPRTALAAAARPFRAVGWTVQERLLWPLGDFFRAIVELAKWPFQRLGWGVERRLLWPSQQRFATWGYPRRIASAAMLLLVAAGATASGVLLASQDDPAETQIAAVPSIELGTETEPARAAGPSEPSLQGAAPVFGVKSSVRVSDAKDDSGSDEAVDTDTVVQADPEAEAGQEEDGAAATSNRKPVPAGPDAMKVARRFSNAFVFYEVGKRAERAREIFEETATPQLSKALGDRPPRLPANAKVPKAKVLNLVPGPRRAKTYTVSVSLLRVGVTSELRLKMKRRGPAWVVTDVRG